MPVKSTWASGEKFSHADANAVAAVVNAVESSLGSKANASTVSGKLDKSEAASTYVSKTDADNSYAPVPSEAGTSGQVLTKTSTGTVWATVSGGGSGGYDGGQL